MAEAKVAKLLSLSTTARRQAQYLIEKLGIRSPIDIDLDYIAWECGAMIREEDLNGAEGRVLKLGERTLIAIKKAIPESGKKRFIAAHEIGHLVLGHSQNQLAVCTNADLLSWYQANSDERDANVFASELLMPEKMFAPLCLAAPTMEHFESLAKQFNSSLTASIIRYVSLTPNRVAVALIEKGYIKWANEAQDFGYQIQPSEPALPESYVMDHFAGREVSRKFEFVEAKAWIADNNLSPNSFIRELVIPMPVYKSALSVLWIDREIAD